MVTAISNKIDTSNFTFIGVENQYLLAIAVLTDSPNKYINFFSKNEDLISYVDVSQAGFELPAVEILFTFSDKTLLSYLCEKSVFVLSIGKTIEEQVQSTFSIITAQVNQKAEDKWAARIVGVYNNIAYMKSPKTRMFFNSSSEIVKQIFLEDLGQTTKANVDVRSRDNMYWHQSKESDYQFLYKLWLHSYIPDSVWLTAIDFEGTPKITDLRKQAKTPPKIMLTTGETRAKNAYTILDQFDIRNNSSMNNIFGGYAQTKSIYNLDESRAVTAQKKESVLLSESDLFNRATNVRTQAGYSLQTSNVHSNYYSAPLQNKSMILGLKSLQLDVTAEGEFLPVELLDYIIMKDAQSNGQAQEDYSGIYMVGKIAHQIANSKIYTHVTIWREAMNTVAVASIADKAEEVSLQLTKFESKINEMPLLDKDSYQSLTEDYEKLKEKLYAYEEKVQETASSSKAFKLYKDLAKKYRTLQGYMSDVYSISSSLVSLTPFASECEEYLSKLTIDSPFTEVQSAVRKYLDLSKYVGEMESKISGKTYSNSVYSEYQKLKNKYNQVGNVLESLKSYGIIGDLNEYIESEGAES